MKKLLFKIFCIIVSCRFYHQLLSIEIPFCDVFGIINFPSLSMLTKLNLEKHQREHETPGDEL